MRKTLNIKSFLVFLLMVIAAVVFIMQINKANAWLLICLYWAVLTIKNRKDYKDMIKKEGEDNG